jgi:hypothetical protein
VYTIDRSASLDSIAGRSRSDQVPCRSKTWPSAVRTFVGCKKVLITSPCYQELSSQAIPLKLAQSLLAPNNPQPLATMHASFTSLAAFGTLVQLLPGASAHGFVNLIKTGGKFYPGWDLNYYYQTNPPAVAGWSTTALDSGFVSPLDHHIPVHNQTPSKLTQ